MTLTNRAATGVVVTGILMTSGIVEGDCTPARDFTFEPLTRTARPNSTTVVLNQLSTGSGCCLGRGCAGACKIQDAFQVLTDLGAVPAGNFNFKIFYQNCPSCSSALAAAAGTCPLRAGAVSVTPPRSSNSSIP